MPNWTEKVVGLKHTNRITNKDIAEELGVTQEYISMVINGKKTMPNAKNRIFSAIEKIKSQQTK